MYIYTFRQVLRNMMCRRLIMRNIGISQGTIAVEGSRLPVAYILYAPYRPAHSLPAASLPPFPRLARRSFASTPLFVRYALG